MKKTASILFTLLLSSSAQAGFNGLTAHSRANCLTINEAISWDATRNWGLKVNSYHYQWQKGRHVLVHNFWSTYDVTWREAAIHLGEGRGDWEVVAEHYVYDGGTLKLFASTKADNCSIYDGWWNSDHPERKS